MDNTDLLMHFELQDLCGASLNLFNHLGVKTMEVCYCDISGSIFLYSSLLALLDMSEGKGCFIFRILFCVCWDVRI